MGPRETYVGGSRYLNEVVGLCGNRPGKLVAIPFEQHAVHIGWSLSSEHLLDQVLYRGR